MAGPAWQENGAHAATRAESPKRFIGQHVTPLFYQHTEDARGARDYKIINSERAFWALSGEMVLGDVRLEGLRLTDWFPRTPGVYWSINAQQTRENVWSEQANTDAELGKYFS